MIARRMGYNVLLVEKNSHPRFAIGESTSPLANLLLEEIAEEYGLDEIKPFCKWGTWQKSHPEIGCGLKRGFTFYFHQPGQRFKKTPTRINELLVSASPHAGIADTHWYRPDFDLYLYQAAAKLGVKVLDQTGITDLDPTGTGFEIKANGKNGRHEWSTRYLIDATGPRGFLFNHWNITETPFDNPIETQSIFTHFREVKRLEELQEFQETESPPYPVDDAAVHHLFPGGWIWVLRFNNGITSAGVSLTSDSSLELDLENPEGAWKKLMEQFPSIRDQFSKAVPCEPWSSLKSTSFQSSRITGTGWAMLPSATGFVDPLLSTGFPLTLLGIQRLGKAFSMGFDDSRFESEMNSYAETTKMELQAVARLIACLFRVMDRPEYFTALTHLYFGPAAYGESMKRLGKGTSVTSFLLADHPDYANRMRFICSEIMAMTREKRKLPRLDDPWLKTIRDCIEPINVGGFLNPEKKNWYPVEEQDLLDSASKLETDSKTLKEMLFRSGFFETKVKPAEF